MTSYATRTVTVELPEQILEQLDQWCFINRVRKKEAVIRAVEMLLAGGSPSAPLSPSSPRAPGAINQDDDIDDVDIIIINEFTWLTGRTATAADKATLRNLKRYPLETVLVGMLETVYNARKKKPNMPINSLAYFEPQILANVEQGIGSKMAPREYIAYLRAALKKYRLVPDPGTE